jgi:dihydroorotase
MNTETKTQLTITRPDDWHLHLRDGAALKRTVADSSRYFNRAIIMPNLCPPVTTTAQAIAYHQRIIEMIPAGNNFEPLMTLYLTDNTSKEEIIKAKQSGVVTAVKLYPAGATTNSDAGVSDLKYCYETLEAMQDVGMPLLIHGEVTHKEVDIFDREKTFIDQVMKPLLAKHPKLKVVFEHITTQQAAEFVENADERIAATITPQHLLLNRNDMLVGGIRPHNYCLPVLKRSTHQQALIKAATSGSTKFFLGTDSAPHPQGAKESACGCAGMYSAHAAIELYAEAFESAGALDKLEAFASFNGPDFYGLERNKDTITLEKESWAVPESYDFGDSTVIPMRAGQTLSWKVKDNKKPR